MEINLGYSLDLLFISGCLLFIGNNLLLDFIELAVGKVDSHTQIFLNMQAFK